MRDGDVMRKLLCLAVSLLMVLSGCGHTAVRKENWGSFSPDKTNSYDNKYYAAQSVEEFDGVKYIAVSIYTTQNDEFVSSFTPARARDFWGICWENDTYNIWIQSGDIGVLCYKYKENKWLPDSEAVKPNYIKSKYEK